MARWTNGRWKATLHRVVNPPPEQADISRRLSLVFFHNPNHDAEIAALAGTVPPNEAAAFPPTTSGAHPRAQFVRPQAELLVVLDRPEVPLHTNGSENDIRCQVTRRKVSAGTRSVIGRDCRDAFLGLAKTCDQLGIKLWDYLGDRLTVAGHTIVGPLHQYVGNRVRYA